MRHLGWIIGIVAAVLLHAGFLLFGGLIFGTHEKKAEGPREVELVSDSDAAADEKKKDDSAAADADAKDSAPKPDAAEEIPNAEEVVKNIEVSAAAAAPALDAASLSAIEQALSGQAAAGEFSDAMSFASGGRIGGTARAGVAEEKLAGAFSLAEIDQKPRATFRGAPTYPAEMRGKKVEGVVTVIFVVDENGKVTNPKVEKSTHPAFDRPALEAVRQWRFEPGLRGGERVGCKMRVPIRFQKS